MEREVELLSRLSHPSIPRRLDCGKRRLHGGEGYPYFVLPCHFQGADRLTWQSLPPVTLAYLSPQALQLLGRSQREPDSYCPPTPADELYALGVTAHRLVTGQYPARGRQRGGMSWSACLMSSRR